MEQYNLFYELATDFCFPITLVSSNSLQSVFVRRHCHVVIVHSSKTGSFSCSVCPSFCQHMLTAFTQTRNSSHKNVSYRCSNKNIGGITGNSLLFSSFSSVEVLWQCILVVCWVLQHGCEVGCSAGKPVFLGLLCGVSNYAEVERSVSSGFNPD